MAVIEVTLRWRKIGDRCKNWVSYRWVEIRLIDPYPHRNTDND